MVLVSHDGFNQTPEWKSILVVPLSTSASQAKRGPTVVAIPGGTSGLTKPSIAICHQVTTLDRSKLTSRIGALSSDLLKELEAALIAALDIDT